MKNPCKIILLLFLIGFSNFTFANVETDTVTNWQLYKDSELLLKSNDFESKRYITSINLNDKFINLALFVFYDFTNQIIDKKIEFIIDNKVITEFRDTNNARKQFIIPKAEIDKFSEKYLDNEILIRYSDGISINLIIGSLKFNKMSSVSKLANVQHQDKFNEAIEMVDKDLNYFSLIQNNNKHYNLQSPYLDKFKKSDITCFELNPKKEYLDFNQLRSVKSTIVKSRVPIEGKIYLQVSIEEWDFTNKESAKIF